MPLVVFRPFKDRLRRRAVLGLVIGMLFGLFGCGSRKTPEQAAQQYLEKKYGGTFVVEQLTRKENDSVMTKDYSGYAYRPGEPLDRFIVWVSGDRKTVRDSAYALDVLPALREWVSGETAKVWPDARTTVTVRVVSPGSRTDYEASEFREFLKNEYVSTTVHVVLEREALTEELVMALNEALQGTVKGYVNFYLLPGEEAAQMDLAKLLDREADLWIGIGTSRSTVETKFENMKG